MRSPSSLLPKTRRSLLRSRASLPALPQKIHGNAGIGKKLLGVRNGLRSNFLGDGKDTRFDGPAEAVNCIQQEQVKSSWISRWPHTEPFTLPPPTTLEIASLNEECPLSRSSEGQWTGRPFLINTPLRHKTQATENSPPWCRPIEFHSLRQWCRLSQ